VDFGSLNVFEDASTYPAVFTLTKALNNFVSRIKIESNLDLSIESILEKTPTVIPITRLTESPWNFDEFNLLSSLDHKRINWTPLSHVAKAYIGVLTGMDKAFVVSQEEAKAKQLEPDLLLPYAYRGEEVDRYGVVKPASIVIYPYKEGEDGNPVLIDPDVLEEKYPNIHSHLLRYKNDLMTRVDSRKLYANERNWFRHLRAGSFSYIRPNKLIIKGIGKIVSTGLLSSETAFNGANCPAIIVNDDSVSYNYILSVINSKVSTHYLNSVCPPKLNNFFRYNASNISSLPIPNISPAEQQPFITAAEALLAGHKQLHEAEAKFGRLVRAELGLSQPLSGKLALTQPWPVWSVALEKALGRKLSLSEKSNWVEYFTEFQAQQQQQRATLRQQDEALDQLVYALYALTPAEVALVEGRPAPAE
jgi:hypothetical protein